MLPSNLATSSKPVAYVWLDSDARTYIQAVEAADGFPMDGSIKNAVNRFVVGCKNDGIWNAIQSCCILSGARTLAGALVPLKGTAPTNYNFLSSDYDYKSGLKGDGLTKYLDTNRANTADSQNDSHIAVFKSTISSDNAENTTNKSYIGAGRSSRLGTGNHSFRDSATLTAYTDTPGFSGISRSASGSYVIRNNKTDTTITSTSEAADGSNYHVFKRNEGGDHVDSKISFYSIGSSIDLALLDARVTKLMRDFSTASVSDLDALAYIAAVEAVDGQPLEEYVRTAINEFVTGCKADDIWDSIKASCFLAGPRTLAGALIPLRGTAPTNYNFVSGDYDRKTGLKGNGSTKYLDSNRNNNADPQNSRHRAVFVSVAPSATSVFTGSSTTVDIGGSNLGGNSSTNDLSSSFVNNVASAESVAAQFNTLGLKGQSRSAAANYIIRSGGTSGTYTRASATPLAGSVFIFDRGPTPPHFLSNARLSFYSLGESIDLALLDARVTAYMEALSSPYDADTQSYITAVETADTEPLEDWVKTAIDNFIRGCKADDIWDSIKSCCILAGARTLAGALVPLKGQAPTNNSFVGGDYNRVTGLIGDGISKHITINRLNNADPQDNNHNCVYVSEAGSGGTILGVFDTTGSYNSLSGSAARNRTSSGFLNTAANGFLATSRNTGAQYVYRNNNLSVTVNDASGAPAATNLYIFRNGSGYNSSRVSFYSVGEYLDLELYNNRVDQLMNDLKYDPDSQAYFDAVEEADQEELEQGVKDAIDTFIRGCKADGIWNSIKSSCIMMGARTLEGALVPLKGTAPTSYNFVSGDYDRKTGLVGDGATKYLDSSRASNADPQDNSHIAVYAVATGGDTAYIGQGAITVGATHIVNNPALARTVLRCRSQTEVNASPNTTGLIGISRSLSASFIGRLSESSASYARSSETPSSSNHFVFARNNAGANLISSGRLSFYSIGESLDLSLLDSRVTTLNNSIKSVLIDDADAVAYITAVETTDGQALEPLTRLAINDFIIGCKSDGTWDAIKSICVMMGARTLAGALVPLKGTAPTNYNFVSGDYDRKTGLKSDGSTKYLNSNRNSGADPQDDRHLSVYVSNACTLTGDFHFYMGTQETSGTFPGNYIGRIANTSDTLAAISSTAISRIGLGQLGFQGASRSQSTSFEYRTQGATVTASISSESTTSKPILVFTRYFSTLTNINGTNARLSFYSIGENVNLALLDARVTALSTAISTAF